VMARRAGKTVWSDETPVENGGRLRFSISESGYRSMEVSVICGPSSVDRFK